MEFLSGYRSKLAGIGAILGGLALMINGFLDGKWEQVAAGYAMVTGGMATLGIAGKIEKAS